MSSGGDTSVSKWMVILAWISGLGLLTYVFSGMLEKRYNPNDQPASQYYNGQTEVTLKQNRAGHYVTSGTINGQKVVFLIDTGATDVAIPAHLQQRLGLEAGYSSLVQTANGTVRVSSTQIERLSIGEIEVRNVKANLNPGMDGDYILLGMSVLRQLEFTQRGDSLILRTL
ncbi:TIGR02281 family clan AA aspartic protease [Alteromonas aestuariivivens]|uniref:TIGR02281 family clan AA aspartic protease n=1 Tax=Alteromonas aestuariivivens TaxID=1938339 RepID=A0A3D8MEZ8_9ALTE|nr:TIGR02281 family clan AA aspartic protease [Alteromonas aestuariivivens]RDV29084.1 TIGR02281 family clan AA aspartic protease [Alteromonas aestuariivivens]